MLVVFIAVCCTGDAGSGKLAVVSPYVENRIILFKLLNLVVEEYSAMLFTIGES